MNILDLFFSFLLLSTAPLSKINLKLVDRRRDVFQVRGNAAPREGVYLLFH